MRFKRGYVLILLGLGLAPCGLSAQQSAGIAAAGFTLDRASDVAGVFNGCDRGRQIRLKDGTVFSCGEHYMHYAFEPHARIYRDALGQNWIFIVDGRAYAGALGRVGERSFATPQPTRSDFAVASLVAPSGRTGAWVQPLMPLADGDVNRPIPPGAEQPPNRRYYKTELGPSND